MFKFINNRMAVWSAAFTTGMLTSGGAFAESQLTGTYENNLANMTANVIGATGNLPGLVSVVAYISGLALGVLGVLKLKDHVENPSQTPLKDGAVRLGAGGALLALPYLYEVLITSVTDGQSGQASEVIALEGLGVYNTVTGVPGANNP